MNLPSRCGSVSSSLRVYFGRCSRKGLFLCDGEPAACGLLGVALVEFGHGLFEGGGVEAVGENGSVADDVGADFQLLGVPVHHLGLDLVPDGFGFGLGFLDQSLQLLQFCDLSGDFNAAHVFYLQII